jgi:type I restriction enzyme S subunit
MRGNKINGFKGTEVGLIPEDWNVAKLGDVAKVSAGGSAPQEEKYFKRGRYPFVRVQHIHNEDFKVIGFNLITDEAVKKYRLKLFSKGTIVFPKSGATVYLEKRALLPFDAYIVNHLCAVLSKNSNVLQKYLFYFLVWQKLAKKKESGYPTINLSEVKNILLPLPPFSEQQKIAKVLDTIQQAIETQDRIIKTTKNLKKSLMQKLFTEGIKGEELKETEIGLIPKSWEIVRLGEVSEIKYGYRTSIPRVSELDGIPIISMADITSEGQILWNNIRRIRVNSTVVQKHQVDNGEVLFNWRNSPEYVGKTAIFKRIYSEPYICASFIIRIKTNEKYMNNAFLHYQIMFMKMNGYFAQKSRRAVGQTNFNASVLKKLHLSLPLLPEQQEIANILSTIDRKIEIEQRRKDFLKQLFKTMLHKLMSGEIRLKEVDI